MQQAMGDQLGQPSQPTMVQSQPQLVQQQHLVQQQQMLQGQQQMLQPQQQHLLQQQQILQSQQHIMQPQQQMLQGQQILQGQQQMLQGQQQLMQQMVPQQLGQQMMYCPVRLVYDTPVLMQGDQMQQQNQSLFVNQPPWARQVQNQVIYVQQIGPNLVPVQHLDPNIYLHQNIPMYQQVVQNVPQLVQNLPQNVQQVRPVTNNIPGIVQNFGAAVQNVQDQNVAQLQNLGFIQANQNANNANINVNNEERRIGSPMTQQNAQNQDVNQVYRQVLTQVNQPQRPLIQMTNQVQDVQTNQQIGGNIGQNINTNRHISNNSTQITQNVPTSVGQMRQITAQAPTTMQNTNQNVRMVTTNVGTHVTNVAQNINANIPQVRHVMPQAVSYAPRGIQQQNLQSMNAQSTAGNVNTVTYSAVRNGQPYTYRAIQPKPNANIRNYTPRAPGPTVRKPLPNLIQTSIANTSVANNVPAQGPYIKTEAESPLFNKKRKSESPDETQKKISNFGSVTVTSQMKDKTKAKYGVNTSEIGVNTSPVHKPKVPTDNQNSKSQQPLLQINPMEAKIKQEAKPAEVACLNSVPVLHMKPTFAVKTEAPVEGNIQQTLTQTNQAEEWYAKYLLEQKQEPKNEQLASQQNQHPAPQYHMIIQQPTGQQMTVQYPQHMTIQPQPSQQMTLLHPPKSQKMALSQPMHMPVQLMPNQQMNMQMPMNQSMTMQHPTNQQMAIPATSQSMTTQPQKGQTTMQPPKGHQMTSQQPTNQAASPQRIKKDMSQQTEEKLVRKTVYPQATTRGRLLDDKTNSNTPKLEELKPSNVPDTMNMNLSNPHVPNTIPIAAAPKTEVPHIPIKPVEPTKKLEEKRIKTEEPKSLPMLPTTNDVIPKVAPIKKEIVAKSEPALEQKMELKTSANMTTISDTLKEIIRDTIAKKEESNQLSKTSIPTETEKTKKIAAVKAEANFKIEKPNPTLATEVPKALDSIKQDIKVSETKISTDFEKVIKDNKIEKKEYKDIPINEMSGKEVHMVDGNIRKEVKEKDYILTHVLDGFVIQESNVPFAVRRPLKEKTVNAVGEEKEKTDPSMKNLTKEEMKDKILELSQLHLEDGRDRREAERQYEAAEMKQENDENKPADEVVDTELKDAVTANPFKDLNHNVVKSWTVEDLTSHLMKHNWTETVSLLQEHEIDGESIFLVTKNQLVTIGLNEAHAELICDFVGNKN